MRFDFTKVSLFIGIPAYQRWLAQPLVDSLDMFLPHAMANRLSFAKNIISDTDVAQARNELVARFRMSEMPERLPNGQMTTKPVTHLLMVDDDISFEPDVILRMLALGHPVVAGICPKRVQNQTKVIRAAQDWLVRELYSNSELLATVNGALDRESLLSLCDKLRAKCEKDLAAQGLIVSQGLTYNIGVKTAPDGSQLHLEVAPDGTVEVDRAGTGFILIERSVFDTIEAQCPEEGKPQFVYQTSGEKMGPADNGSRFNFFQRGLYGDVQDGKGQYMGEDFFFSELCLGSGIPVRAYAPAAFGHFGQMVFQGQPLLLPKG